MFSLKNKLDPNLKIAMNNKYYKNYRVIIQCKALYETIEKKIKSIHGTLVYVIPYLNSICAILSSSGIDKIIEYPQVTYITWDTYGLLCGNSVLKSNGVHFQERYKLTGKNVCIGLVDSGVYPHADLLHPKNKIKKFTDLINGCIYPYDDNGHGSSMAGIICGSGYLSKGIYKGIAEGSNIYCIKAFNGIGKGYISDILFSIYTLIEQSKEFNIKVICLPFEVLSKDFFIISLFSKLFDIAVKNNISIVAACGHNGNTPGTIDGIASLQNCITVGGVDTSRTPFKPYKYSSSGPYGKLEKPDLCAAAVDICSLNTNKNYVSERNGCKIYPKSLEEPYVSYTGTSCSAAFISGICALLYENDPDLTFNDLISLLKVSCNLLDISKWIQGSGMIDINKFLP